MDIQRMLSFRSPRSLVTLGLVAAGIFVWLLTPSKYEREARGFSDEMLIITLAGTAHWPESGDKYAARRACSAELIRRGQRVLPKLKEYAEKKADDARMAFLVNDPDRHTVLLEQKLITDAIKSLSSP